ncbi:MAG TPA: small basic protein [Planctomycetota bacterium]|nr:small basic protein [Planctomycetota bacterium]
MSIHKSLKQKDTLVRNRSVLTRWERILKLQDIGRWTDGGKVTGLPKVRVKWKVRKKKKEAAAPVAGAAAAPAAGAAAPAAGKGAAPAAGKAAAAPAAAGKAAAPAAAGKAAAAPAAGKKK